jgi:hypothetical protein
MTITIKKWIDDVGSRRRAIVNLNGNMMEMFVIQNSKNEFPLINSNCFVEFEFDKLLSIKRYLKTDKMGTCIRKIENEYKIIGLLHNIIEIEEEFRLYDLYILEGPEFILVKVNKEIERHSINDILCVRVEGLCAIIRN